MKCTTLAFLSVLLISCDAETASRPMTIDTPEGKVNTTVKTADLAAQRVVVANPAELLRLRSSAAKASEFAAIVVPEASSVDLKVLDEAFRRWQEGKSKAFSQEQVVEALGAALGEKMVADLDMEWVVVTDQYGTDYGVRSKKSEVMAFPFSSVQKRVGGDEYDFMIGIYRSVQSLIESGEYKPRQSG